LGQDLTNSVPAVAVTQREQVILNWNRLKGCVGSSLDLVRIISDSYLKLDLISLKWNNVGVLGIVKVWGEILRY